MTAGLILFPATGRPRWGAWPTREGARFQLWAPALERLELVMGEEVVEMTRAGEGWWWHDAPGARPGLGYAYRLPDGLVVPDPASKAQAGGVHGPSMLVDEGAFAWRHPGWRGRPWEETVLYELHPGTFSPDGTCQGIAQRLDHLAELGITAVELTPVADVPGARNWGYDGVLFFAPNPAYGSPEDLKVLIDAAHGRGLMMFLDVVYNHFGPDGNYLHAYAPDFFHDDVPTPWGPAIAFDHPDVRSFVIQNVLHWVNDYRFDGLRFDAVHALYRPGQPHLLEAIAEAVRVHGPQDREVHLVLENDSNEAHWLERGEDGRPRHYAAQWNDDIHHAAHTLLTGEASGYYADFADDPPGHLLRCLAEGFAYQGDASPFRDGERRGEVSRHLPPTAFVSFLQNHDQTGNRAFGERLASLVEDDAALACVTAIWLLAPQIPLFWMGQEWNATTPFLFFCDFQDDLADAVREGRRREFAKFAAFSDPGARARIPDPNDPATFAASKLDWSEAELPRHAAMLALTRDLLAARHASIVPLLARIAPGRAVQHRFQDRGLHVGWPLEEGAGSLELLANAGPEELPLADGIDLAEGCVIHAAPALDRASRTVPGWSWFWRMMP